MRWMVLAMVVLLGACADDGSEGEARRSVTWSMGCAYPPDRALELAQADSMWRSVGVEMVPTQDPGADVVVCMVPGAATVETELGEGQILLEVSYEAPHPGVVESFAHQMSHVVLSGDPHLAEGEVGILARSPKGSRWSEADLELLASHGLSSP